MVSIPFKGADWPEGPDNLAVIQIRGVAALLNINYKINNKINIKG